VPTPDSVKEKLESITNVCVVVLIGFFLLVFISIEIKRSLRTRVQQGLVKGVVIDKSELTAGVVSEQILIIAMSKECEHCVDSASFYREIARRSRASGRTQVIALFPSGTQQMTEFLSRQQLHLENIKTIDFDDVKLSTTPTLILLDRSGKILDFWIGTLSEEGQRYVLNRL
jgi:hypothetical protein